MRIYVVPDKAFQNFLMFRNELIPLWERKTTRKGSPYALLQWGHPDEWNSPATESRGENFAILKEAPDLSSFILDLVSHLMAQLDKQFNGCQ